MAYEDFKNLPVKAASDKALRDRTFDVAKIQIMIISTWNCFNAL